MHVCVREVEPIGRLSSSLEAERTKKMKRHGRDCEN